MVAGAPSRFCSHPGTAPTSPPHRAFWPPDRRRRRLIADKGYDANSLRNSLKAQQTEAVIPSTTSRKRPIPYDRQAYRQRNRIERAFCSLKDFRRIATRYDKLARNFLAAVEIAAVILWWT